MKYKKALKSGLVLLMAAFTTFGAACSKNEGGGNNPPAPPAPVDNSAPVIKTAPADKVAEIGFYHGLQADIASAVIVDEGSESVKRYPVSVKFGDEVTALEETATSVFLGKVGEYVVSFVAEDVDGNKTTGSYKITAQDTTDPIVDVPAATVAWVENGKVALPTANVVEVGAYSLAVTAKDSGGESVAVGDGYLMTSQTGVYTLTYTATDGAGNAASKESKLTVNEAGVISTFVNADEAALWGAEARGEDGKLKLQSDLDEASIVFDDYFAMHDWSAFERLYATIENERGAELFVTASVLVDGEWQTAATQTVAPATLDTGDFVGFTAASKDVEVRLDNYGFTAAEGVRFDFACQGGVCVAIDGIALDAQNGEAVPADSALSGYFKGKYALAANEGETTTFAEPVTMPSGFNAVTYDVWASVPADVTMGLIFGNKTVYTRIRLAAGWNELIRLPEAEGADLATAFTGVVVVNEENYPLTVCVNDGNIAKLTAISQDVYAKTSGTYAIAYGETFAVPNPFTLGAAYVSDVSVALSGAISKTVEIGEELLADEDNLTYGTYTLTYSYTDALGVAKTLAYTLNVEKKVLKVTVDMPALFMEGENALPDPVLESEVYNATQLGGATVQKLYRERGKSTWIDGAENFAPTKSKSYEVRYIITLGDIRKEFNFVKYVHKNKNVIDFEPESAAGVHSLRVTYGGVDNGKDYGVQPSEFLYDGGPVSWTGKYVPQTFRTTTDWSKSGSTAGKVTQQYGPVAGFTIRPLMVTAPNERVNCVSFWMKCDKSYPNAYLQFASFESKENDPEGLAEALKMPWAPAWPESEYFDIKSGEHFYTVYLKDQQTIRAIGAFNVVGCLGATYQFDDIEFAYINRLSISNVAYETSYDVSKPYALEKPVLTSELFTKAELDGAKWQLTYTLNGGEPVELKADAKGNFAIPNNVNGDIAVTWYATVGGVTVKTSAAFVFGVVPFETETPDVVNQGSTVNVPIPTSEFSLDSVKVSYKFFEDTEWTELTEADGYYSFVAEKQGQYNVRYEVSSELSTGVIYGERVENVYTPAKGVAFTFEERDPRQGAGHFVNNPKWFGANVVEKEDGTHWLMISKLGDSFDGLAFDEPYDLGVDTTKLCFDVYSDVAQNIYVHYTTGDNKTYELPNYQIEAGASVVTIDFAELGATNIRYMKSLYFYLHFSNGYVSNAFYIDNIRIVNQVSMKANIPASTADGNVSFTPEFGFTLEEPADFVATATLTAQYKEQGAATWNTLTTTNGTFAFKATANVYEVKVTATYGGETFEETGVVYNQGAGVLFWDFESDWDTTKYQPFAVHSSRSERSTEWSANGNYSWKMKDTTDGLYGTYIGLTCKEAVSLGKTVSKVGFWTNAPSDTKVCLHIGINNKTAEFIVDIPKGVNYNVFDLGLSGDTVNWFYIGGASPQGSFMIKAPLYFDDIAFYA